MIIQPGNIIVFLVVMTFFLTFRLLDQKDRKIHKARKYIEKQAAYLEKTINERRESLQDLESSIQAKEASTREMLKRVESLLQEIDEHSDDLMKLQAQLTHYHKILKDLSVLTEKAERRIQSVSQGSREIEETERRLEALQGDLVQRVDEARNMRDELDQAAFAARREREQQEAQPQQFALPPEPETIPEDKPDVKAKPVGAPAYQPELRRSFDDIDLEDDPYSYEESGDEMEIEAEVELSEPEGSTSKKDMVKSLRDSGMSTQDIADQMGIPRGEVELLLEILRFAEDA